MYNYLACKKLVNFCTSYLILIKKQVFLERTQIEIYIFSITFILLSSLPPLMPYLHVLYPLLFHPLVAQSREKLSFNHFWLRLSGYMYSVYHVSGSRNGVSEWWEHSRRVTCGLILLLVLVLLWEVFLWVLWFSPLLKNQQFWIPIQSGKCPQ